MRMPQLGDPKATDQLLLLGYEKLRRLAAVRMAQKRPGQAFQATALVHEAWLRLAERSSSLWKHAETKEFLRTAVIRHQ